MRGEVNQGIVCQLLNLIVLFNFDAKTNTIYRTRLLFINKAREFIQRNVVARK